MLSKYREVTGTLKDRHKYLSFGKDDFIGLRFFRVLRMEAKGNSEEMTGELSLYTHLTVAEVLGSYDCQKYLVREVFRITRYSKLPLFTLHVHVLLRHVRDAE